MIPIIWLIILLWPDSVYEKGIANAWDTIRLADIEKIEKKDNGIYILFLKDRSKNILGFKTVRIGESMNLPFFMGLNINFIWYLTELNEAGAQKVRTGLVFLFSKKEQLSQTNPGGKKA